jgi:cytochrome oxidase Cu insertion factor (SCO1/SenC/PrrC family)
MPGMGGTGTSSSGGLSIVSIFQSSLLHQWFIVFGLLAVLAIAWNLLWALQLQAEAKGAPKPLFTNSDALITREPKGRKVFRLGFGFLWLLDGLLQCQAQMPLNLANEVTKPSAATSPGWVRNLVGVGVTLWNRHPVTAATASVWIQIGIAIWLLVASRGLWSRFAGVASIAWGLIVWVWGEAFGGIFAPGLSWLFGAPGGVMFYVVAGLLIALPERHWNTARLGQWTLRGMGAFTVIMGVVQAWPGRGFWQGHVTSTSTPGTLSAMVQQMAQVPQPHPFSSLVLHFNSFDLAHGWAVNLFVVIFLIATGVALMSVKNVDGKARTLFGRTPFAPVLIFAIVVGLADWVLVQDFAFFGGVGTDPNSMIPIIVVLIGGCVAMVRPGEVPQNVVPITPQRFTFSFLSLQGYVGRDATGSIRSFASVGALCIAAFGAIPMGLASLNAEADPIVSQAFDGAPVASVGPAPHFSLVNQRGRTVSLQTLHGKTVVLTFLDPVCVSDCPIIGQELRETDALLGSSSAHVEFIAIDANPLYRSATYTNAFSVQEGLNTYANWSYLSGSLAQLRSAWSDYGISVLTEPNGSMVDHNDEIYLINPSGQIRYIVDSDPGPATTITKSSFASNLLATINETK